MSDPSTHPTGQHKLPGRDDAASLNELCQDCSEVAIDVVERRPWSATADRTSGDERQVVVPQGARDLVDGLSPYGT